MAGNAGDTRLGRRVILHVELRIVKRTTEEWGWVMAPGAPTGHLDVSIAAQRDLAGLLDRE